MKDVNVENPDTDGNKKNKILNQGAAAKDIGNKAYNNHNKEGKKVNGKNGQWLFDFDLSHSIGGLLPVLCVFSLSLINKSLDYSFLSIWKMSDFAIINISYILCLNSNPDKKWLLFSLSFICLVTDFYPVIYFLYCHQYGLLLSSLKYSFLIPVGFILAELFTELLVRV